MFPVWGLVNPKAFHKYYTVYICIHIIFIIVFVIIIIFCLLLFLLYIYIYIFVLSTCINACVIYIYTHILYIYIDIYIYILHIRFQRNAASGKNRATGLEPYGGASLENSNYAVLQFGHGHLVNLADLAVRPPLISDCP